MLSHLVYFQWLMLVHLCLSVLLSLMSHIVCICMIIFELINDDDDNIYVRENSATLQAFTVLGTANMRVRYRQREISYRVQETTEWQWTAVRSLTSSPTHQKHIQTYYMSHNTNTYRHITCHTIQTHIDILHVTQYKHRHITCQCQQ